MVPGARAGDPHLTMNENPPNENDPTTEQPAGEQPAHENEPTTNPPGSEHSGPLEAGPERPTIEQPTTEQSARESEPTTEQPATEQPTAQAPGPRRLYRARDDRVLGGVCSGIAKYFNIDPVLVRVGAVALVFLGGAGILAYLAAVLLIPNEGEAGQPPEGPKRGMVITGALLLVVAVCVVLPFQGGWGPNWGLVPLGFLAIAGLLVWRLASGQRPQGDARAVLRAMALGLALIALCFVLAITGAWAAAAGGNGVVAGIVIAAGVALIAGAFFGSWARWLILPALALALPAGVVAAADLDVRGGTGEVTYRPDSAAAVRDSYRLGVGHLVVDLRDARLTAR